MRRRVNPEPQRARAREEGIARRILKTKQPRFLRVASLCHDANRPDIPRVNHLGDAMLQQFRKSVEWSDIRNGAKFIPE
ncbi:unnamed protein product [Lampetra planeri]